MSTSTTRLSLAASTCVALGLGIASASAAQPSASPQPQPVQAAKVAGIKHAGDAYMGWSHDGEQLRSPKTPAQRAAEGKALAAKAEGTAKAAGATGQRIALTPDANGQARLAAAQTPGIDVSGHQGNVNWSYWYGQGKRWAYVKATESTTFKNPYFAQQYNGSYNIGMIRGAYHFATPNTSSGTAQADYFVNNGGGWSKDGKTLPGALDVEYNPYGSNTCYGLSQAGMRTWIADFAKRYKARTGRDVVIYTTTDWWKTCTGNTAQFSTTSPLWLARYASTPGTLPAGWPTHTFWQYTSSPIDQNYFNGDMSRVRAMANG